MKIAFVNLVKKEDKGLTNQMKYIINNKINKIYRRGDNFFVYNFNQKTKEKLRKKLKKFEYALVENNIDIDFKTLTGETFAKYMIYEIYKNCKRKKDEITICVNKYCKENVEIIKELAKKIKVVNIVTDSEEYYDLDKILEKQNIYITVSSNRRKSMKNTEVMINFDFKSLKKFNFNRTMTIIDLTNNMEIPKSFEGKLIRKLKVTTPKQLRIFADHVNFDKQQLIEYQILNIQDYQKIREYLSINKIRIAEMTI